MQLMNSGFEQEDRSNWTLCASRCEDWEESWAAASLFWNVAASCIPQLDLSAVVLGVQRPLFIWKDPLARARSTDQDEPGNTTCTVEAFSYPAFMLGTSRAQIATGPDGPG